MECDINRQFVILTGGNGAGKTNILESISMFSSGKGLRGQVDNLGYCPSFQDEKSLPWTVYMECDKGHKWGCGLDDGKRKWRLSGENVKQGDLAKHINLVWVTPMMDGMFYGPSDDRRYFIDKMVEALNPNHARHRAAWQKSRSNRIKLLKQGVFDDRWLSAIEDSMARHGVALSAARLRFLKTLNEACQHVPDPFPKVESAMVGDLETALENHPASEVEQQFKNHLQQSRGQDGQQGRTSGARSDLKAYLFLNEKTPVAFCSTGQQKMVLLAMILAFSLMKTKPVLLLDEIAAHLDERHLEILLNRLAENGHQVWLSATDATLFSFLGDDKKQVFNVENF